VNEKKIQIMDSCCLAPKGNAEQWMTKTQVRLKDNVNEVEFFQQIEIDISNKNQGKPKHRANMQKQRFRKIGNGHLFEQMKQKHTGKNENTQKQQRRKYNQEKFVRSD